MTIPVALRGDFKASQLRGLARKTKDGPQARRLLTLAAIYDGATRTEAAKIGGVTLQIIRDWVMRFVARGLPACLMANRQVNPRGSMMCNAVRLCGWSRAARSRRSTV